MSDYIVSARKYRPDSFESLIGQDNIAKTLKNSILRGQLAHAYLFCGPRGVGKTSAARIFAKTINCSNPSADMEPCGECESCRSFAEGRSYCIHELDAASNNGVDDIKALMDQVQIPPQVGKYAVYIIDEVHMLTQSAFNAFLKTLEEPPAHAIFILATTEKHKIIPTILSRCQTYDFNRISIPDIVANLKKIAAKESINAQEEALHIIAQKADGAMRDALTIFDQTVAFCGNEITYDGVVRNLNVLDYEYRFKVVDAAIKGDYATALLIFDEVLQKGFNALHFISALGAHFRDLLVSRTGGLSSLLDLPDSLKTRYAQQASSCSVKFIYEALEAIRECESGYRASTNQRLHIEFTLMKLCFLSNAPADIKPVEAPQIPQTPIASEPEKSSETPAAPAPKEVEPEKIAETPVAPAEIAAPAPKTGASLSLASLMLDDQPQETVADSVESDNLPEDDALMAAWKNMAGEYASRPRLASTLVNAAVRITEQDGFKDFSFDVTNESQKSWIEEKLLHELESKMQKAVNSTKLHLIVGVTAQEQVEAKAYLPSEKARELIETNPEVKNLVSEFGLDIK